MTHFEESRGPLTISTDPAQLNAEEIHRFLSGSYWAEGRSREAVDRSLKNSLCFGLYDAGKQIGFARVISVLRYLCLPL